MAVWCQHCCFVLCFSLTDHIFLIMSASSSSLACRAQNSSLNCSGQLPQGRIRYTGSRSHVSLSTVLTWGCLTTGRFRRPPSALSVVQSSNSWPQFSQGIFELRWEVYHTPDLCRRETRGSGGDLMLLAFKYVLVVNPNIYWFHQTESVFSSKFPLPKPSTAYAA